MTALWITLAVLAYLACGVGAYWLARWVGVRDAFGPWMPFDTGVDPELRRVAYLVFWPLTACLDAIYLLGWLLRRVMP